jgi:glutathione S-transferase
VSLSAVRILDHWLEDRIFLAGDAFTMGDIPAATTVHRWYLLDIDHPELPNVRRWYDLMCTRTAFQQIVMTPLS